MSRSSVDPATVFRSEYPAGTFHIVVFVPSKDRDGRAINLEFWVEEILTVLGTLFRGATAYPRGRGVWRKNNITPGGQQVAELLFEEVAIIFTHAAEEYVTHSALLDLRRVLCRMGREANQGEVGIVVDGRYIGITNFDDE